MCYKSRGPTVISYWSKNESCVLYRSYQGQLRSFKRPGYLEVRREKSRFFLATNLGWRSANAIRKYISFTHCKILIHAFITSKLDYCNSLLSGLRQDHLTNFSLCKLLPHVFWPVLGNMNILGLFLGCLFRKELILNFYFLHLNHLMM